MFFKYINARPKIATPYVNFVIALAIIKASMEFAWPVMAQATPSILVDLSVLNNGGNTNRLTSGGKLAIPPAKTPLSTLHVAPKKPPKIRRYPNSKKVKKKTRPLKEIASKPRIKNVSSVVRSAFPKTTKELAPKPAAQSQLPLAALSPSTAPVTKVTSTAVPPPPPTVSAPAPPGPKVLRAPPAAPKIAKTLQPTLPKAKTPSKEVANLPSNYEMKPGRVLRITFNDTNTRIPKAEKTKILRLANAIRKKENFRLQILAYAGGQNLSTSRTRRMSLSRALAVRSLLIVNGVRSTQIDIRALGSKTDEQPLNRVDLDLAKR